MKTITRLMTAIVLPLGLLASTEALATARLQKVDAVSQGNVNTVLRFFFDSAVTNPKSFAMPSSNMVVLDFHDAESAMGVRKQLIKSPYVKSVRTARGGGKLRVMVALTQKVAYKAQVNGSQVSVTFGREAPASRPVANMNQRGPAVQQRAVSHQAQASNYIQRPAAAQAQRRVAAPKPAVMTVRNLAPIDYRRDAKGNGTAHITLPHTSTKVTAVKNGNMVVLTIEDTSSKEPRKRLNVLDFATPLSFIDIERKGPDLLVKLIGNTAFEHAVRRDGNKYSVSLNRVKRVVKAVDPLKPKVKKYTGKALSLNFQDIEVRSVLQLLADFTDKNIVVSDSVKGNITLRLKSVPWDQALDIVLESKALAMRSNGNVIWVAPAVELQAKEQQELKALERKKALEPLVTEYIAVNFAKAEELVQLISSNRSNTNNANSTASMLSDRGSVSVDQRTNTILVQDTISRVDEVRNMIQSLDVPVKQVSVEARIVIASDSFGKELGARFGVTKIGSSGGITSGSLDSTSSIASEISSDSDVSIPSLADRLNVSLPVTGAAGTLGFSLLAKDYLLDLELSALQAESEGEIVSTPRVVTADKQKASIEQGVEIPYLEASSSGATSVSFKKAVLSLEVTPQVTPDEHVIMDLKINQDSVGSIYSDVPSIDTREINTQVLVDNGQTVVLGGVHEETSNKDTTKVPILADLPYLGKLFQNNSKSTYKRELLIFVTPKIMN
ncbi:type IV pilus secretin PilQ [Leucothrix arctica]|uniref:Type IV pilus secretin PilQ n=1 Tax=Leucothrix arctica TaxID=1481894 RepID=A0A317CIY9_9GAMM|nr:type IV pilus secretin PilQ [Leucothrix arctica]PWQ98528.1 type IV pilus secretin PilQ [Leucothrix arctica]